jgi:hypothetical protein
MRQQGCNYQPLPALYARYHAILKIANIALYQHGIIDAFYSITKCLLFVNVSFQQKFYSFLVNIFKLT